MLTQLEKDAQIVCEGVLCDLEVFVNGLNGQVVVNGRSRHILSISLWNEAGAPERPNGILRN